MISERGAREKGGLHKLHNWNKQIAQALIDYDYSALLYRRHELLTITLLPLSAEMSSKAYTSYPYGIQTTRL